MTNKIIFQTEGSIGTILLNNPEKLNSFDVDMIKELDGVLEKIKNSKLKVVILRGKGKSFCSGGDIYWERQIGNLSREEAKNEMGFVQSVFSKIESIPQVFIAVIHGYAVGGGNELAMACDIRIAMESAKFVHPETSLGTVAPLGATKRLPRLIGLGRAKYMLFTGDTVDSKTALTAKLSNSTNKALELTKKSVNRNYLVDLNDESEVDAYVECSRSAENKERLDKFLERRKKSN